MLDPFVFDSRGYDVARAAITAPRLDAANAAIDDLTLWDRLVADLIAGPRGVWFETRDAVARYACSIAPGHVQVGPVTEWATEIAGLVQEPTVTGLLDQLFPSGHYVDHVTLSLATPGAAGIGLHGGGHERDPRQAYRFLGDAWDIGLSIVMISLTPCREGDGGTALVPGSHKANLPPATPLPSPGEFHRTNWVSTVSMDAGDVLVFPEALMHGAFPWRCPWERRVMIIKAYPLHLANLHSQHRSAAKPFWRMQ
jgi:hypothetical protein